MTTTAAAAAGDGVVDRRVANALFPDARASLGALSLLARPGVAFARKAMGGLWVGGDAVLTDRALRFRPNALNRAAHRDPETLEVVVPLEAIARVNDRKGMVTQIIDIELKPSAVVENAPGETFSIRCYRARAFSDAIRRQAGVT